MKKKVLLGMSGGVDSSVAAILLQKQGYEVVGCTMKLWENGEKNGNQAIYDAKKVCDKLGILHYTLNNTKEFKCKVVDNFINEYQEARTPNPCIECNRYLKFGCFYKKAKELGCDYMATGHYARIEFSKKYNQYVLKKSKEDKKDQTYFLYTMPKEQIKHILFPLQEFNTKEQIRKIAKDNKLETAHKKDSQEICFIPQNDYQAFLRKYMNNNPKIGNIVLKTGEILGKHKGLINYTIGQRKGLGIAYKEPLYVIKLNMKKNEVIVGDKQELYSSELYAKNVNWLISDNLGEIINCKAKIRYRAKEEDAVVYKRENEKVKVVFEKPQRAITPGQSVVFYDNDGVVLGGGKIQ